MLACLLLTEASEIIAHRGGYFETPQLIALARPAQSGRDASRTEIAEPVWFDGQQWGRSEPDAIRARKPGRVIIDATLSGLHYDMAALLSALPASTQLLRLHSALKLFQQGLELADAGIVTVFDRSEDGARRAGDRLRNVRALCGLGLRFAEIAALELPAFLHREMTLSYEQAIFAHNARLAKAIGTNNILFDENVHPVLNDGVSNAPYCTLRLRRPSDRAYERLDHRIREIVTEHGILLECGGSFGFRGHRYEIVRPENAPAFLRVALGRRPGPSLEKAIALFECLAALHAI